MRLTRAVLLIAAALCSVGPKAFAGPATLRDVLELEDERRSPTPPVARYMAGDGAEFVLDRSGRLPLLKFEMSQEIWVLHPSAAPRGDVIYRNDIGDPVLRATKLGGLTVFTSERPSGAPAALLGEADGLRLPQPLSPGGLLQRLAQASARASRAAQRLVPFEANGVTPGSESMFADAAGVAAEAVARMARAADGRAMLSRFHKVQFSAARKPDVVVRAGVLQLLLTPDLGVAGRPSSERIINAAESLDR